MKAWHKNSSVKKKFWKNVNFWPSYGNLCDLTPRHSRLSAKLADIRNSLKNCPNCTEFFFERCKMKKRDKNTSNQSGLVCFTAFFTSKTSTFRYLDKKNPPGTFFETVLHPYLWKFFNAVFAITRGKDEIMITRKQFYAMSRRFFMVKKNLGGGQNDPPLPFKEISHNLYILLL